MTNSNEVADETIVDQLVGWLSKCGDAIRHRPMMSKPFWKPPLKTKENQTTSKLWVAGSSPAGRAKINGLEAHWLAVGITVCIMLIVTAA